MSINSWMDKDIVVLIYKRILLSHKKECIWFSSNEVEEPRAYYTEWSKSEKEKQISYIKTYIRNLKRWYWWTYLQDSSGDANTKNRLVDTVGEEEGGTNWESNTETYTLPYVKQIVNGYLLYHAGSSNMVLSDNLERWDGMGGRRHTYTYGWFMFMYGRK